VERAVMNARDDPGLAAIGLFLAAIALVLMLVA
jgi:hypothetical protein